LYANQQRNVAEIFLYQTHCIRSLFFLVTEDSLIFYEHYQKRIINKRKEAKIIIVDHARQLRIAVTEIDRQR
jgi:hypothetical protein